MNILDLSILMFVIMESANVIILYFKPEFKYGNGVSVFKNFENAKKKDDDNYLFIQYLVNWVAGVKLIFIVLLIVILFLGDDLLKVYSIVVVILSILTYFFRLAPIMKKLDSKNMLKPSGYSKTLDAMIIFFIVMFTSSLIIYFL